MGSCGRMTALSLGLVSQVEEEIYTQRFAIRPNTVGPSACCMITESAKGLGRPNRPASCSKLWACRFRMV